MDNLDAAIEKLRAAADAARQGAQTAQAYSDQLAAAGHVASGGAIDPFVFRLAIFALACDLEQQVRMASEYETIEQRVNGGRQRQQRKEEQADNKAERELL